MPHETGKPAQLPGIWEKEPKWVRSIRYKIDIGPRQFAATVAASIVTVIALAATLALTPGDVNGLIVGAWLVGLAAGIALTSVGVYGGVLVPGLPLKKMQVSRDPDDVPTVRVAGIGTISGMFSGISGAGWGPMGVTLLILSRLEPRIAVGSSVFGRIFMAAAAVISAFVLLTTGSGQFANVVPEWELVPVILTASLATMLPGALLTSRLGRTRMSVLIATVSISLAGLALARTLFF